MPKLGVDVPPRPHAHRRACQNKPCYLENRVVREPCKRRTACILFFVIAKMTLTTSQALGTPHFSKDLHPLFKRGCQIIWNRVYSALFALVCPFFLFIRCDNLAKINLALHRCFFFSSPCNILTTFFFFSEILKMLLDLALPPFPAKEIPP